MLADFFAGGDTSREGVQVGTAANADGEIELMGVDLSNGSVGFFGADGGRRPGRGGHHGGAAAGTPLDGSGFTAADLDAVTAAVVGTYSGSGSGLLTTLSGTGAQTAASANATVTLTVTAVAAAASPDDATTDDSSSPRAVTLTGTLTVAVDGQDALTLPFTGTLQLARGRSGSSASSTTTTAVSGHVTISTDRAGSDPAAGTGFDLDGSLDGGELAVERLVASDRTDPAAGTVFQSPESRRADRIVLTMA